MTDLYQLLLHCGTRSTYCFTLVDMQADDRPLVAANDVFLNLTQYSREEIIGRNCKFLQGPKTSSDTIGSIRSALSGRMPFCEDILNYRKDGSAFWNRLVLVPITLNGHFYFCGFQHDVTDQVQQSGICRKPDSAVIGDRINNPLTVALAMAGSKKPGHEQKLSDALSKISSFVLNLS